MDRLTDDLAAWLHAHGVGVGRTVGIFMDHCEAYALAYIAAHKAGGAYMPLEVRSFLLSSTHAVKALSLLHRLSCTLQRYQ